MANTNNSENIFVEASHNLYTVSRSLYERPDKKITRSKELFDLSKKCYTKLNLDIYKQEPSAKELEWHLSWESQDKHSN
jgi:hypothetical protein